MILQLCNGFGANCRRVNSTAKSARRVEQFSPQMARILLMPLKFPAKSRACTGHSLDLSSVNSGKSLLFNDDEGFRPCGRLKPS